MQIVFFYPKKQTLKVFILLVLVCNSYFFKKQTSVLNAVVLVTDWHNKKNDKRKLWSFKD